MKNFMNPKEPDEIKFLNFKSDPLFEKLIKDIKILEILISFFIKRRFYERKL